LPTRIAREELRPLSTDQPRLTARFREALIWAAELHEAQRRKGSETPYVGHLLAVAATVIEHGGDEDQAIAALLHDAIEDQGGDATREEMRSRFGDRVVGIVDACTDTDETPKPPWRVRKQRYLDHLAEVPDEALLISLADKHNNVSAILRDYELVGEKLWERFSGGRDGTLWYYRSLADRYVERGAGWLATEVDRLVGELEERAALAAPGNGVDAPKDQAGSGAADWGEVRKERFRTVFLENGGGYGPPGNEHGMRAWTDQYEGQVGWSYVVDEPESPRHTRMHVSSSFGIRQHRIFFMTEEGEESFYDFPGREDEG
jgi:hypothetical protein